jgi:hypothetical protein
MVGMGKLVLAANFIGRMGNDFATEETMANGMLGLPKEDLDEVVARILKGVVLDFNSGDQYG